jgi:hypothetical protein
MNNVIIKTVLNGNHNQFIKEKDKINIVYILLLELLLCL